MSVIMFAKVSWRHLDSHRAKGLILACPTPCVSKALCMGKHSAVLGVR